MMKNKHIAAILALAVGLGGALVLFGWIAGYEELLRPVAGMGRPKPIIAFSFVVAAVLLFLTCLRYGAHNRTTNVLLACSAMYLIVAMGSQLLTVLSGQPAGLELVLPTTHTDPDLIPSKRAASLGTILTFFLIALVGLIDNLNDLSQLRKLIGIATITLPGLALVGHLCGVPFLYFKFTPESSAMAFYTAVLGLLAGLSIYFSSSRAEVGNGNEE